MTTIIVLGTYIRYEPNWESLDKRPLPLLRYEAKIGTSITSVPSSGTIDKTPSVVKGFSNGVIIDIF